MKNNLENRKQELSNRLKRMKDYLLLKFDEEDYHGVADAAMDIREILAELKCIDNLLKTSS